MNRALTASLTFLAVLVPSAGHAQSDVECVLPQWQDMPTITSAEFDELAEIKQLIEESKFSKALRRLGGFNETGLGDYARAQVPRLLAALYFKLGNEARGAEFLRRAEAQNARWSGPAAGAESGAQPLVIVLPEWPETALRDGLEGSVTVRFTILEDGTVSDSAITDARPRRIFDRNTIRAVQQWKFKPRTVNGRPVRCYAMKTVSFRLGDQT